MISEYRCEVCGKLSANRDEMVKHERLCKLEHECNGYVRHLMKAIPPSCIRSYRFHLDRNDEAVCKALFVGLRKLYLSQNLNLEASKKTKELFTKEILKITNETTYNSIYYTCLAV